MLSNQMEVRCVFTFTVSLIRHMWQVKTNKHIRDTAALSVAVIRNRGHTTNLNPPFGFMCFILPKNEEIEKENPHFNALR